MAGFEQTFLEHITNIRGVDFYTWDGWQTLMEWVKRQPWRREFLGGDKVPSRLLHPPALVEALITFLGG